MAASGTALAAASVVSDAGGWRVPFVKVASLGALGITDE
jgi:hypothetical protein